MTIHVDSRAIAPTATPAVYHRDGTIFASSRDVASFFTKQHKHVVRDIEKIGPDLDPSTRQAWFRLSYYHDSYGRPQAMYEMTRDGFTLLAMGFTGKTALAFKVRYIEEFNRMEVQLKAASRPALPDFTDPAAAAIAWAEQYRAVEVAKALAHEREEELKEAAPKVAFHDEFMSGDGLFTSTQVAKMHGMSACALHRVLEKQNIIMRARSNAKRRAKGWMAKEPYASRGYFRHNVSVHGQNESVQMLWTTAGITWLARRFQSSPRRSAAA